MDIDDICWEHIRSKLDVLADTIFNKNPWDGTIMESACRFEINSYGGPGSGRFIYLLTPEALKRLPYGTEVTGIFGDVKVKGVDYLDTDTRGDFTAWGIPEEDFA